MTNIIYICYVTIFITIIYYKINNINIKNNISSKNDNKKK